MRALRCGHSIALDTLQFGGTQASDVQFALTSGKDLQMQRYQCAYLYVLQYTFLKMQKATTARKHAKYPGAAAFERVESASTCV